MNKLKNVSNNIPLESTIYNERGFLDYIKDYKEFLDVWSPQYNKSDADAALSNWIYEKDGEVCETIFFRNLICEFNLGENNTIQNKQWDACLYSPKNDKLILLMKDGDITPEEFKNKMDEKNINYNEIYFEDKEEEYEDDNELPQFWTARDNETLNEFLDDSIKEENCNKGVFYPNVDGEIMLYYTTNKKEEYIPIEGRKCSGVIKMEDKTILLLNTKTKKFKSEEIYDILNKKEINFQINYDRNINLKEEKNTIKI